MSKEHFDVVIVGAGLSGIGAVPPVNLIGVASKSRLKS